MSTNTSQVGSHINSKINLANQRCILFEGQRCQSKFLEYEITLTVQEIFNNAHLISPKKILPFPIFLKKSMILVRSLFSV